MCAALANHDKAACAVKTTQQLSTEKVSVLASSSSSDEARTCKAGIVDVRCANVCASPLVYKCLGGGDTFKNRAVSYNKYPDIEMGLVDWLLGH